MILEKTDKTGKNRFLPLSWQELYCERQHTQFVSDRCYGSWSHCSSLEEKSGRRVQQIIWHPCQDDFTLVETTLFGHPNECEME